MHNLGKIGVCLLLIVFAIPGRSAPSRDSHLDLKITIQKVSNDFTISGKLNFYSNSEQEKCFLLPYLDNSNKYLFEPLKHLEAYINKNSGEQLTDTSTKIINNYHQGTFIHPNIFKVHAEKNETVSLSFISRGTTETSNALFSGFYPLPLKQCDISSKSNNSQFMPDKIPMNIEVTNETSWHVFGPGQKQTRSRDSENINRYSFNATKFSLILVESETLHQYHNRIDGFDLHLYFRSPIENGLIKTIKGALKSHQKWFSSYPYESLTIVETESILSADQPGLIAINQPRQIVFNYLQDSFLNWKHWVLSTLIAAQWYGASITVADPRDDWLLGGICDFATLMFLRSDGSRFNLFNNYDSDFNWLSLNYLQVQDMTASLLFKDLPFMALTDSKFESTGDKSSQNPLLFIKQALTMRYLASIMGSETLQQFQKQFSKKFLNKPIQPIDFYVNLRDMQYGISDQGKKRLAYYLKSWWSYKGWPDYSIDDFSKTELSTGKWLAKAIIKSNGNFELPTQVRFEDEGGNYYYVTSKQPDMSERRWLVTTITDLEPIDVSIDPNHHMYDSNRFDNQASAPGINFFPVGSNTISDDSYTSIWIPYIFRRPGESSSIAIQAAIFRYLQSGVFGKIEYSPDSKKLALLMSYEYRLPEYNLGSELAILQTYSQFRTTKFSLFNQPGNKFLNANAALRYRQIVGNKESFHPTLGLGVELNIPSPLKACTINSKNEVEHAPLLKKDGIKYFRLTSLWTIPCRLTTKSLYTLRSFHGILADQQGYLPYFSLFRPNQLDELGIRIDEENLPLLRKAVGLNQDILLPFWLPFVEKAMILSNKLKFRIFHDIGGRSFDYQDTYEAAGLGFLLPFGGDIVGFGSLTISKFSILGILYSRKQEEVSRKPRIVFDLSGKF